MLDSAIETVINLATRGARVLFVCERREQIPEALTKAHELVGDNSVYVFKTFGAQRIETVNGGRIYFAIPKTSWIRGHSVDAVFAPPSAWGNNDLAADLITATNGSEFFGEQGPLMFSTFQRLGG